MASHPRLAVALTSFALAFLGSVSAAAAANQTFAADPYTNSSSQHQTEVEPDTFAYGGTEVSAYQVGRFSDGGASNVGFARTTDGSTWTSGFLPGTTKLATPAGPYDRVTDAAVAYDARDNVWLISTLGLTGRKNPKGAAVLVSRSSDGAQSWGSPVVVAQAGRGQDFDKNWIACDNWSGSPHYGNCYVTFDDYGHGDRMKFTTSSDGGRTWGAALNTGDSANGLGGQPVVQPNGNVIVPFANASITAILSTRSTNGGASWASSTTVSAISEHTVAASMRADPLPSAEIDGLGNVYVVWSDCRFRTNCSSNDIVLTSSGDGVNWAPITGVPIDPTSSTVDHFIPGIGVDPSTSGSGAHLALTYYYFPNAGCSTDCQLGVGYISSTDGGAHWSSSSSLASGISPSWIASTSGGNMVGDYISTSILTTNNGTTANPVFAVATAPSGGSLREAMATPTGGLPVDGGTTAAFGSASAAPVATKNNPSVARSAGHRER